MKLISIKPASNGKNKYTATFDNDGRTKTTHFGAAGYKDFIQYSKQSKEEATMRKASYLARHKKTENWNDPTSAGSLSRYILWGEPTLAASIKSFKNKFSL
jgi:hypothetical protein